MAAALHVRKAARNNAWSNDRLLRACAELSDAEFKAARTSFFPSLFETLNHSLSVDLYYLDMLEEGGIGLAIFDSFVPLAAEPLRSAQLAADRRLVTFCDAQSELSLPRLVETDRGDEGKVPERVDDLLAHLFQHQIHHRGQAHAMLAGTRVPPPQLDEYFLVFDASRREAELAALGIEGPEAIR
ncbi:damage-inducible protein DinB [Bosea caraganae]|uniref:Damage-inducible protein DinB n=1 Tax=Bosea caraganae TaxID=2763117 RepID=A0A370L356_9HYPH|nr:DinB family protein [Bosea caraganae]RDJ22856.1 damage-inducible protein DinB [Bosea caraganae]RDJ28635.1 damage-inducible protein DinB [Bosea caraganae]